MNKKDCERLAMILVEHRTEIGQDALEEIFKLDSRVKDEWILFNEVEGRNEAVNDRADEILKARFKGWGQRPRPSGAVMEAVEQARREIYGDDYHPNLFKCRRTLG